MEAIRGQHLGVYGEHFEQLVVRSFARGSLGQLILELSEEDETGQEFVRF